MSKLDVLKSSLCKHRDAVVVGLSTGAMSLMAAPCFAADPTVDISSVDKLTSQFGPLAAELATKITEVAVAIVVASFGYQALKVAVKAGMGFLNKMFH